MLGARWNPGAWFGGGCRLSNCLLLSLIAVGHPLTAGTNSPLPGPIERWEQARARYAADTIDRDTLGTWLKACADAAWASTNKAAKARYAEEGIAASRQQSERFGDWAGLHYYRALNLGMLASTRGLSALRLVGEMEAELLEARRLDPKFNYGAPDRCLGGLYLDAPGWPISVGSRKKARLALENALQIAPEYPENYLALAEALVRWKELEAARQVLERMEGPWTEAEQKFTGPAWAEDWIDWRQRRQALARQLP